MKTERPWPIGRKITFNNDRFEVEGYAGEYILLYHLTSKKTNKYTLQYVEDMVKKQYDSLRLHQR